MTKFFTLVLLNMASISAFGQSNIRQCAATTPVDELEGVYYVQFAAHIIPVPTSLIVVPQRTEREAARLALVQDNQFQFSNSPPIDPAFGSSRIYSMRISKGTLPQDLERYEFASRVECSANEFRVIHLKDAQAKISMDEMLYIEAGSEQMMIAGEKLEEYMALIAGALYE